MSGIRFTDEFKRDAVAQVVDRGYSVAEVSVRLGISTKSLYTWKTQFSQPRKQIIETTEQASEIRRLKKELARVSEERIFGKNGSIRCWWPCALWGHERINNFVCGGRFRDIIDGPKSGCGNGSRDIAMPCYNNRARIR